MSKLNESISEDLLKKCLHKQPNKGGQKVGGRVEEIVAAQKAYREVKAELDTATRRIENMEALVKELTADSNKWKDLLIEAEDHVEKKTEAHRITSNACVREMEMRAKAEKERDALKNKLSTVVTDAEEIYDALWPDGHDYDKIPAADEIRNLRTNLIEMTRERDEMVESLDANWVTHQQVIVAGNKEAECDSLCIQLAEAEAELKQQKSLSWKELKKQFGVIARLRGERDSFRKELDRLQFDLDMLNIRENGILIESNQLGRECTRLRAAIVEYTDTPQDAIDTITGKRDPLDWETMSVDDLVARLQRTHKKLQRKHDERNTKI